MLCIILTCAVLAFPRMAFADDNNEINTQQLPDSSFIYDMSIIDVSNADSYYDNQTIQVVGEVVGDSLFADADGHYRWITLLSEDANSNATVTVYMSAADAEMIDTFGKYGSTGTMLRVSGVFHLACSEHEGLSDIHAEQVTVVSKGAQNPDSFDLMAFVPGIGAILIGLTLVVIFRRLQEKRR